MRWLRLTTSAASTEELIVSSRSALMTLQILIKTAENRRKKIWTTELIRLKSNGYERNIDAIVVLERKLNDASEKFISDRLSNYIKYDLINSEKMTPKFLRMAESGSNADLAVIRDPGGIPFAAAYQRDEYITGFYESLYKNPAGIRDNFDNCVEDF